MRRAASPGFLLITMAAAFLGFWLLYIPTARNMAEIPARLPAAAALYDHGHDLH